MHFIIVSLHKIIAIKVFDHPFIHSDQNTQEDKGKNLARTHENQRPLLPLQPRVLEYSVPMKKHWVNPNCQNSEPMKRTVSTSAIIVSPLTISGKCMLLLHKRPKLIQIIITMSQVHRPKKRMTSPERTKETKICYNIYFYSSIKQGFLKKAPVPISSLIYQKQETRNSRNFHLQMTLMSFS